MDEVIERVNKGLVLALSTSVSASLVIAALFRAGAWFQGVAGYPFSTVFGNTFVVALICWALVLLTSFQSDVARARNKSH